MPGVLTTGGWKIFDTQKEADEFKAKMEKEENINTEMDEAPQEFIKNLKKFKKGE